ncbi:hypothetical protein ARTHRO9AX_10289 [Arthrobacter sp. 9AX]|nr:hypothetical protein ARTHRO9AX_10289 [Arthrobacter sp. 9AX]
MARVFDANGNTTGVLFIEDIIDGLVQRMRIRPLQAVLGCSLLQLGHPNLTPGMA